MADCYFCARAGEPYVDVEPLRIKISALPHDVADTLTQLAPSWELSDTLDLCAACKKLAEGRDFIGLLLRTMDHYVRKYGSNARLQMFSSGVFPLLFFAAVDKRTTVHVPADAPTPWKTALTAFADATIQVLETDLRSRFPVRMFANGVGVHAELLPDALQIITIYSTKPGAGNASATLDDILRHADEDGTDIILCAYPIRRDDRRGLSLDELVTWYGRRNFVMFDAPPSLRSGVAYEGTWMRRTARSTTANRPAPTGVFGKLNLFLNVLVRKSSRP